MKFGIFAFCALAGVIMIYIGINGLPDTGNAGGIIESPTSVLGRERTKKTKNNITDMLMWGGFVMLAAGGAGMLIIHMTKPDDRKSDSGPPPI